MARDQIRKHKMSTDACKHKRHKKGNIVKHGQEAEFKTEYLAEAQWKQHHTTPPKTSPRKITNKNLE